MNIIDFPISIRTKNVLASSGYKTEEDLKGLFLEDLKKLDGLGNKGISELREYVYSKFKITFKSKPKPKKTENFKEIKALIETFLKHSQKVFWPKEIMFGKVLLSRYDLETLQRVKPLTRINSLGFYLTDDGKKYIRQFLPLIEIVKSGVEETGEPESLEEIELVNSSLPGRPKSIRDFLKNEVR